MAEFGWDTPATLFYRAGKDDAQDLQSRDFTSTAEAVRYAVEDLPGDALEDDVTHISSPSERLSPIRIREAYAAADFPLARRGGGA